MKLFERLFFCPFLFQEHIEIEKNKEEVLLSNQWGSFFSHDDNAETGPSKNCEQCINNVMDGFLVCQKTKERREMNTFWGDLIQRHSTVAIPRIDFITGELFFSSWLGSLRLE